MHLIGPILGYQQRFKKIYKYPNKYEQEMRFLHLFTFWLKTKKIQFSNISQMDKGKFQWCSGNRQQN